MLRERVARRQSVLASYGRGIFIVPGTPNSRGEVIIPRGRFRLKPGQRRQDLAFLDGWRRRRHYTAIEPTNILTTMNLPEVR